MRASLHVNLGYCSLNYEKGISYTRTDTVDPTRLHARTRDNRPRLSGRFAAHRDTLITHEARTTFVIASRLTVQSARGPTIIVYLAVYH
jgi:hypothetical protein